MWGIFIVCEIYIGIFRMFIDELNIIVLNLYLYLNFNINIVEGKK